MLSRASALPFLVVVAIVLGVAGCPPGNEQEPAGTWQEAFDARELGAGAISGVWGPSADDVYAVGGGERGTVVHYDGARWTKLAVPDVPLLIWVHGTGADDVWAVGIRGGALRFDGETWTKLETGTTADLWGVFARARDDVWIVGGNVAEGEPVVLHWDGADFTRVPVPASENPVGAHTLFKVWGIGEKLFAVGQRGLILEHTVLETEGAWVSRPAGEAADDDFVSLWGTREDNIVVVGGRANARVATYDGERFTTVAPFGEGGLSGVYMDEPGEAVVVGVFGLAGRYDPRSGEVIEEDSGTRFDLHAVWGDGEGRHYAVGGNFAPPYAGVALVRTTP